MKFKIHTKEVRRAAKKKNLKINSGLTVQKEEYDSYGMACPIGAIYCKEKDINFDDEDAVRHADNSAIEWAEKRYGKYYTKGFIEGFDSSTLEDVEYALELHDTFNSKQKKSFKAGYLNGKLLARYLLDD